MSLIDSIGTFIGTILEHSLGVTKNGFPQLIVRLKADQKYVGDTEGMKHFELKEPAYVDWSTFNEDIVGYLVLFKSKEVFDPSTALMNYEQLQLATGWDGSEFDSLNNGSLVGKQVLFRVEENTYEGKTRLQVNWIDAADAAPERSLKALDPTKLAGLNALLKVNKPAAKPVAAAAKPAATKPGKPAAPAATPTVPAAAPAAPAATSPVAPAAPKPPKAPKAPKQEAPPAEPVDEKPALPAEITQEGAWGYVVGRKGDVDDTAVQDAWIAGCQAIGGDRDEDDFNNKDWAAVRDHVVAALKL